MTLSVLDRLLLLQILPKAGTLLTLRIVRDLQKDIGFSEQDFQDLNLRAEPTSDGKSQQFHWDKEVDKDVAIGPQGKTVIREALTKFGQTEEMTLEWLGLCDKFQIGQEVASD